MAGTSLRQTILAAGSFVSSVLYVLVVKWCHNRNSSRRSTGRFLEVEKSDEDAEGDKGAAAGRTGDGFGGEPLEACEPGVAIGGLAALAVAGAGVASSSMTDGLPKSHWTPCLAQLPHRGWTSSH